MDNSLGWMDGHSGQKLYKWKNIPYSWTKRLNIAKMFKFFPNWCIGSMWFNHSLSKLFCGYWHINSGVYVEKNKTQNRQYNTEEGQGRSSEAIQHQDLLLSHSDHDSVMLENHHDRTRNRTTYIQWNDAWQRSESTAVEKEYPGQCAML